MDLDRRTLMKLMSVGALSPIGVAEAQDSDPTSDTSEGTKELQKQTCIYQRPEEERSEIDAPANCNLQLVDPARGNTYYSPFGIEGWHASDGLEVANGRLRLAQKTTLPQDSFVHHYQASDQSATDGDSIYWTDSLGNDDLSQGVRPTYRENVVNGEPALEFNNTDTYVENDNLSVPVNQPMTLYFVFSVNSDTEQDVLQDAPSGGDRIFLNANGNGSFGLFAGSNTANGGSYTANTWYIAQAKYISGNGYLRVNGTQAIDGKAVGSNDMGSVRVGIDTAQSRPVGGYIAEILHYDKDHSTTERDDVESYLKTKYGVTF